MTPNNSTVNKLNWIIKDQRFNLKSAQLGKFDYNVLLRNKDVVLDQNIVDRYEAEKKKVSSYKFEDGYDGNHNYIWENVRRNICDGYDISHVVDNLVIYLFKEGSRTKVMFWDCFADIVLENIKDNIEKPLDNGWIMCEECGERVYSGSGKPKQYCDKCARKIELKATKNRVNKYRTLKRVTVNEHTSNH